MSWAIGVPMRVITVAIEIVFRVNVRPLPRRPHAAAAVMGFVDSLLRRAGTAPPERRVQTHPGYDGKRIDQLDCFRDRGLMEHG